MIVPAPLLYRYQLSTSILRDTNLDRIGGTSIYIVVQHFLQET